MKKAIRELKTHLGKNVREMPEKKTARDHFQALVFSEAQSSVFPTKCSECFKSTKSVTQLTMDLLEHEWLVSDSWLEGAKKVWSLLDRSKFNLPDKLKKEGKWLYGSGISIK